MLPAGEAAENRNVRTIVCSLGLVIFAGPPASAVTAPVAQSCAPKATGAKILRTKNLKDVDPNWAPPAFIGTSWSLIEIKREGNFCAADWWTREAEFSAAASS